MSETGALLVRQTERIAELERELTAAQKDAERYRWMKAGGVCELILQRAASFSSSGEQVRIRHIRLGEFDAAIDAHKLDNRAEGLFEPHGPVIVAHDPFDDGEDAGGLAVRHGSIILHVSAKKTGAIDVVCDWATGHARKIGADWFVWDGDGMGTGLKRQISTAFDGTRTQYHMFRGSLAGSAQDNAKETYQPAKGDKTAKTYADTFKNNRAQYYIALANRFKATYDFVVKGKHSDPSEMISLNSEGIDDMVGLRSEMCRIPRKPDGNGLEQIMSKIDMKKAGIRSPNMSDAVMMTMFSPSSEANFKQIDFDGWR